jgi:polyphosphate kinase 2 (PPK2 family)
MIGRPTGGRHCLVDGEPGSRFDQILDVDFNDSATILAEAIQALVASNQVKRNDIAGETISSAVDSIVAKKLWDETGACAASAVSARDRAAAEAAIPGSTTALRRRNFNIEAFKLPSETPHAPPVAPAKIVTHVTFGH